MRHLANLFTTWRRICLRTQQESPRIQRRARHTRLGGAFWLFHVGFRLAAYWARMASRFPKASGQPAGFPNCRRQNRPAPRCRPAACRDPRPANAAPGARSCSPRARQVKRALRSGDVGNRVVGEPQAGVDRPGLGTQWRTSLHRPTREGTPLPGSAPPDHRNDDDTPERNSLLDNPRATRKDDRMGGKKWMGSLTRF